MANEKRNKILGLITARGGSKGIPEKNIKELAGKPLIAYTIEAAHASGVFDRLMISTDDEKIAAIGRQYGCEVPFMRPTELAQDKTPHLEAVLHAVTWLKEHERYVPDAVMILQPTAPFRTADHIREAVVLFETSGADSIVSVAEVPGHHHPRWQVTVDDNKKAAIFTGEPFSQIVRQRQDLSKTYTRNGAVYLFKTTLLSDPIKPNFYGDHVAAYVMAPEDSINIDTMDDWKEAEKVVTNKKSA